MGTMERDMAVFERYGSAKQKYVNCEDDPGHVMCLNCEMVVQCVLGKTDAFKVKVGLHQGSVLTPFLFVVVKGVVT